MNNDTPGPETDDKNSEKIVPNMPPFKAAILALIAVFFLYQFGGGLLALLIFGFDVDMADMNLMRLLTIGSQILLILFPAILFSKLVYEDVSTILRFKLPKLKDVGLFTVGLILLVPLLQNYLLIQNFVLEKLASSNTFIRGIKNFLDKLDSFVEETYSQLLIADNVFEMFLVVIAISVTPAICEEFFFRGFVQKSFEYKVRPIYAIFLTAVFFGMYHFNPYGLIPLIVIGLYLGLSVYMTNSIFIPIIIHFLNNFFAIASFYFFGTEEFIDSSILNSGSINYQIISFIILLFVFVAFIYFIINNFKSLERIEVKNDLPKV